MRRVSIAQIMRESGLSRATVDRVLNGRSNVHPRTRAAVEETLRRLSSPEPSNVNARPPVDLVVRLGRGMTSQLRDAWSAHSPDGRFVDMYQAQEQDMVAVLEEVCRDKSQTLILCAKNTDGVVAVLRNARREGKRVIAIISDLAAEARDFFVGIDNRAAGQTAAFLIGRALGDRLTPVGVVVGDLAFRCHEDREIGFRAALRAHHPRVVVAAEVLGEDNPNLTREAVKEMLKAQPTLGAIYNVGAGNLGLAESLRDLGRAEDLLFVGHEANFVTSPLLRSGALDYVIAQDSAELLSKAIWLATTEQSTRIGDSMLINFAIYTRFNLPSFSQPADI